jgi:murein DD-endopeptidase MepM/ murein hydrolase activator NlpD
VKILEVLAPDPNNDGRRDQVILSLTPWFKPAGWDEVIKQVADKTKEDPIAVAVKVNDWKQKNIGATPKQAFKAITGDKSAMLQDIEVPGVDLNKQPPEDNGQWIDQGRWWISKEPMLRNGRREFAMKIDMNNPTTWPRPVANKCPKGWELDKAGKMCLPVGTAEKKEVPPTPVDGKCEKGYKLSPDGKTCIPDGSTVIPAPTTDTPPEPIIDVTTGKFTCKPPWVYDEKTKACVKKAEAPAPAPAGETEEQKKARLKKEAEAKAVEDQKKEAEKKKESDKKDDTVKTKLIWPAGSSAEVNRSRPLRLTPPVHKGIDIAVPPGTKLVAPEAGTITAQAIEKGGAGLYLKMSSTVGKRVHIFMHLSGHIARKGDVVAQGDELGQTGGKEGDPLAGNARGKGHLHWGVQQDGVWIDPEPLTQ